MIMLSILNIILGLACLVAAPFLAYNHFGRRLWLLVVGLANLVIGIANAVPT